MTSTDHIATLTAMLELWAEGSLEHVVLEAAIAAFDDSARLDKIERLRIAIRYEQDCERGWVGSSLDPDGFECRYRDLRASIDRISEFLTNQEVDS